jgi:hypothetical protein
MLFVAAAGQRQRQLQQRIGPPSYGGATTTAPNVVSVADYRQQGPCAPTFSNYGATKVGTLPPPGRLSSTLTVGPTATYAIYNGTDLMATPHVGT